ncbi:MAG: RNA methyltransferase [Chlorobiaceae bacterium]|nr:RNA methyltransferase [Chlorobiaceae bacterium]
MRHSGVQPLGGAKFKLYCKLQQKKYRDGEGLFLAEGLRTVRELCGSIPDGNMLQALLFREGEPEAAVFDRTFPGKVFTLTRKECARLAETATPSGIFGVFRQQPASASRFAGGEGNSFLVALDDVQDPGNVGTILRTAAWFGASALICSTGTADRYNPKAVRSSAGSIFALPHYGVASLEPELRRLADEGFFIVTSSLDGRDFREFASWPEKLVLVIGNEANGVSPAVQALSHRLVKIPHAGKTSRVESLNASVSAAILMERMALK